MRRALSTLLFASAALLAPQAHPQWDLEESHTTASLRGIHSLGGGVAWASGSEGTVIRTEDGGFLWQPCTTPPGAEHLDFRGIQAFDANTAIVMSSGKGDLSRLYKTTDGCQTWHLVFTNPDPEGFWDAMAFSSLATGKAGDPPYYKGMILGDPVNGHFVEFYSTHNGDVWEKFAGNQPGPPSAREGEAIFAASNSALLYLDGGGSQTFVTGGTSGNRSRLLSEYVKHDPRVTWKYVGGDLPLAKGESAGAFSIATSFSGKTATPPEPKNKVQVFFFRALICLAVGGGSKKTDNARGTAAFTTDGGQHWKPAQTPPHGYRSAVAYDPTHKAWITVGPNGTDLSRDDGRTWTPLRPTPSEPPTADRDWNALSLPFVVGPNGRIGKLRDYK